MDAITVKGNRHKCPVHGDGPVERTQKLMSVCGQFVATVDDICRCGAGQEDPIVSGSLVMSINGKAVARKGDRTQHGGEIMQGVDFFVLD